MNKQTEDIKKNIGVTVTKSFLFEAEKADIDYDNYEATVKVSSEANDRADEIVQSSCWDEEGLKDYIAHSVLLANHERGKIKSQIGKAQKVFLKDNKLYARFKWFVGDGNEDADWAWKLLSKYKTAAFSISFIRKEVAAPTKEQEKSGCWIVTKKASLTEISQVLVPCNQDAVLSAMKSMDKSKEPEIFEFYKKTSEIMQPKEEDKIEKAVCKAFELFVEKIKTVSDYSEKVSKLEKKIADFEISEKQLSDKVEVMIDEFCKKEKVVKAETAPEKSFDKVLKEIEELKKTFKK